MSKYGDGAVFSQGGQEWIAHVEWDDDGWVSWSECGSCGTTVLGGDDSRSDHYCLPCAYCGERGVSQDDTDKLFCEDCDPNETGLCMCGDRMCPDSETANHLRYLIQRGRVA